MRGLYAIVDLGTLAPLGLDPLEHARAALEGGARTLQLRDKSSDAARGLALLEAMAPLARSFGAELYANDRVDLALLAGADGVHVGQSDVPPARVRALAARAGATLRVGRSTHHERELRRAVDEAADYVAIGPVASTGSKPDHEPVLGLDEARRLAQLARSISPGTPLVAIGGIDPALAEQLAEVFDAVAVIGGLLPTERSPSEVERRARRYARAFGERRP